MQDVLRSRLEVVAEKTAQLAKESETRGYATRVQDLQDQTRVMQDRLSSGDSGLPGLLSALEDRVDSLETEMGRRSAFSECMAPSWSMVADLAKRAAELEAEVGWGAIDWPTLWAKEGQDVGQQHVGRVQAERCVCGDITCEFTRTEPDPAAPSWGLIDCVSGAVTAYLTRAWHEKKGKEMSSVTHFTSGSEMN
jgi:hypothetical protein